MDDIKLSSVENGLYSIIQTLNSWIWEQRLQRPSVETWLENFDKSGKNDEIRIHGLYLLTRLLYFGKREIENLAVSLYRDLFRYPILASIRRQNAHTLDGRTIEEDYKKNLMMTRFWGLGGPSESGSYLLYHLRTANDLPTELFPSEPEIHIFMKMEKPFANLTPKIIFIDDFCGSGKQASDYAQAFLSRALHAGLSTDAFEFHYYSLLATVRGLESLREKRIFARAESVIELDDSFKVFSESSRHFRNVPAGITKERLKQICEEHGKRLYPSHRLGKDRGELVLSMTHNTPNNTLPVIWSDGSERYPWTPILRRAGKKKKL